MMSETQTIARNETNTNQQEQANKNNNRTTSTELTNIEPNSVENNNQSHNSNNKARSLSQGPPRSRAQLLARKQQLLTTSANLAWSPGSTGSTGAGEAQPAAGDEPAELNSSLSQLSNPNDDVLYSLSSNSHSYLTQSQLSHPNGSRLSRSQHQQHQNNQNNSQRGLSAEAKLESLSEQLKVHQSSYERQNLHPDAYLNSNGFAGSTSIEDVYILVAKQKKDLQLAGELGKVLLEKNNELSKINEQQAEEYSRKLESLEEEKHKLRRQVEQLEGEYENRLIEAQTDCRLLEAQLEHQRQEAARREREKSRLIEDLGHQNQRLASELAEATRSEELLSTQIEQLKERLGSRGSQRQDQDVQLEALKSEIEIVSQRKQDFERRLRVAVEERGQLTGALEESGERLLLLESLLSERDSRIADSELELAELREATSWLSGQLDAMISLNERLATNEAGQRDRLGGGPAAADELELGALNDRRSQLIEQLRELRLKTRTRTRATEMKLIGERRLAQQKRRQLGASRRPPQRAPGSSSADASDNEFSDSSIDLAGSSSEAELERGGRDNKRPKLTSHLARDIYKLLRDFQRQLEARRAELQWRQQQLTGPNNQHLNGPLSAQSSATQSAADDSGISAAYEDSSAASSSSARSSGERPEDQRTSQLNEKSSTTEGGKSLDNKNDDKQKKTGEEFESPKKWQKLLSEIRALVEDLPCSTCHLMIGERQKFERLSRDFSRLSEELKRCDEERIQLSGQKGQLEAQLSALEEECESLKADLASGSMSPDEIVKLAWQRRDEAVKRKNACEIALAKSRIENMQLSSQLMEVVQQKSRLAQQVAQFEDDMHYMTQDSVKAKFSWEEQAERLRRDQQQLKRQQQQQSQFTAGLSLGPLTSLLGNFSSSSSVPIQTSSSTNNVNKQVIRQNETETNDNKSITNNQNNNSTKETSIMRQFATNRLKLTRFWTKSAPNQAQA